ncbi:hypothetical protein [Planctomyces sp. SH-PL14]|uniref:hypothetical protein n=1 Tax=Planctomyces sp. SH-PL14 TaxID=1632864 RepID=UPI00078D81E3|nr:hypothetical protein [Planctomyces sp. SH-PL14]AMV16590.1 hypothetical protein VT03_01790 [Planctomyces sp. SH-PL14]
MQLSELDGRTGRSGGDHPLDDCWDWVPDGSTWWDPVKDVEANKSAVMAGFADPRRSRARVRRDIYQNIRSAARVKAFAEKLGIPLSWIPILQPVEVVEKDPE